MQKMLIIRRFYTIFSKSQFIILASTKRACLNYHKYHIMLFCELKRLSNFLFRCTTNPLQVYTESTSGVHQIHFGCTRNPSQVYNESTSGVHGIHLRCTTNPFQVYTESISGVQQIHFRCTPNPRF